MRDELTEGFGHLWQAAAHAAGGVGATVGPRWESAKEHVPPGIGKARGIAARGLDSTMTAFLPLVDAARSGAESAAGKAKKAGIMKARKRESGMARKRTTILVGILAAGITAGAASAVLARRRQRTSWEEYEQQGVRTAREDAKSILDTTRSTMDGVTQQTAGTPDPAREPSYDAHHSSRETGNLFADQAGQGSGTSAARLDAAEQNRPATDPYSADKASTISKNSRP
jgi:hypothetical protein